MRRLLYWCTVQPQGRSNLAAIRFAAPVRISSISIFPAGARPFANENSIVARTEPEAFCLEIFLNAHLVASTDPKEKPRASNVNVLVPTLIVYTGRQTDFPLDMGPHYSTRLLIVKGNFELLSMAIYGNIITDLLPSVERIHARTLPSVEHTALSKAIDPSVACDPTSLARLLLELIPDSPPLPLVVRLMFCLKPSNDDWDLPAFPYLHADLTSRNDDEFDLETVIIDLSKPIRDDASYEDITALAIQVQECVNISKNPDKAYQVAKLLSVSASQHPGLIRALLEHLDVNTLFSIQSLDEDILLCLLDAAANVDVARGMNNEVFLSTLHEVQVSSKMERPTQQAAKRLSSRIIDWHCFEDALSNIRGDFNQSWNMLYDVGTEEQSIGIWLESMILHEDVVTKLAENPVLASFQSHSPLHFRNKINISSQDAFVSTVRAYVGIACVLAVWAWTDSLGNDVCRERALAILHIWQGIDGYSQIVNHLLLLRQFTRRLEWISSDKDPPRQSGFLAEKIIFDLAKDPRAIPNEDLIRTILSLEAPLSFITDNELLSMRKVALVSEDGLPAAVEELMFSSDRPFSLRRLRTLRVSLAIVAHELDEPEGEWQTLQAFWDEKAPGIVTCLVAILINVGNDLNGHFIVTPPPKMNQALADQLLLTADDLLQLITTLTPSYPITVRSMKNVTRAVADLFACTDAADMLFSQSSPACLSARGTRHACVELMRTLSGPDVIAEPGRLGAEVILQTLLQHAHQSGDRDPANHVLQMFTLLDHVLPEPEATVCHGKDHWVMSTLPKVLQDLHLFLGLLDHENRGHFVKRLIQLDNGVIGIGEWLLTEALKDMTNTIQNLATSSQTEHAEIVLQYQITLTLQFLLNLMRPSSSSSSWCLDAIATTHDLSIALTNSIMALLNGRYTSQFFDGLVDLLSPSMASFEPDLRYYLFLAKLRVSGSSTQPERLLGSIASILTDLEPTTISPAPFRLGLGKALAALSSKPLDEGNTRDLLSILKWLPEQANAKLTTLYGITQDQLSTLFRNIYVSIPAAEHPSIEQLRSSLIINEDEHLLSPPIALPDVLKLSIHDIDNLMRHDIPPPTTPNGTRTPDILGLIISPPTAVLRSQVPTTGLTKTYVNNDFRQLRQTPSARQNTSRLPSMHGFSRKYRRNHRNTSCRLGDVCRAFPDGYLEL